MTDRKREVLVFCQKTRAWWEHKTKDNVYREDLFFSALCMLFVFVFGYLLDVLFTDDEDSIGKSFLYASGILLMGAFPFFLGRFVYGFLRFKFPGWEQLKRATEIFVGLRWRGPVYAVYGFLGSLIFFVSCLYLLLAFENVGDVLEFLFQWLFIFSLFLIFASSVVLVRRLACALSPRWKDGT